MSDDVIYLCSRRDDVADSTCTCSDVAVEGERFMVCACPRIRIGDPADVVIDPTARRAWGELPDVLRCIGAIMAAYWDFTVLDILRRGLALSDVKVDGVVEEGYDYAVVEIGGKRIKLRHCCASYGHVKVERRDDAYVVEPSGCVMGRGAVCLEL